MNHPTKMRSIPTYVEGFVPHGLTSCYMPQCCAQYALRAISLGPINKLLGLSSFHGKVGPICPDHS